MAYATDIPVIALQHRYAVMQNVNGAPKQVGIVMANNYSQANKKALQLFSRHVWVERLT